MFFSRCDVHQFVYLVQNAVNVAAFPALDELDVAKDHLAQFWLPSRSCCVALSS